MKYFKNIIEKSIPLIAFFILISFLSHAEIYIVTESGNYDQKEIWLPNFPGNVIQENDTVVINTLINQNIDLVVKGTIIVKESASLTGSKGLLITKSGTLFNLGEVKIAEFTNRGVIYNQQSLNITLDFVNSGNIINHSDISVGNMIDNTGMMTGKEGMISANRKFVNSRTGIIKGNLDVCSNNFLNVEGGIIDTKSITFCNNPIFDNNSGMLSDNNPIHFKRTASVVSLKTGGYSPF